MCLHACLCLVWSCLDTNTPIFADCQPTYGTIMGTILRIYTHDGKMLHNMGEIEEVDYKVSSEVSAEMTTKHEDPRCHIDALIFAQLDVCSLMDRSNTPSKTVRIPKSGFY